MNLKMKLVAIWCARLEAPFSCLSARFVVVFERFGSIVVGCGRRGIRSTYVQERVPTCVGIARFVVVSESCVSWWLPTHFRRVFAFYSGFAPI